MSKSEDYKKHFKDKKITLIGLGLLGRGVGDAKFLAECGADVLVTDLKSEADLKESVDQLKDYPNIKFVLGEHRLEDFKNKDFVLKSAGVPMDSPYIEEARKNNIPVVMSSALFAKLSPVKVVGITGTRGKSTVTHLIYEILRQVPRQSSGHPEKSAPQIFLGGNVKGVSTLSFLKEAKEGDIAVLELDSWQLQGFGDEKMSPHVAVFTTFFDDHLNYYGSTTLTTGEAVKKYFADKANIFKFQKRDDFLVIGSQAEKLIIRNYNHDIESRVVVARGENVPEDWNVCLPGEHNRHNIACAVEAVRVLGISEDVIRKGIENFKGVSGRLELIREIDGIKIYNDTTATTPEATIAGLRALNIQHTTNDTQSEILNHKSKIILIAGGADKGLNMEHLVEEIPKHCKEVIFLSGSGTEKLMSNDKFQISKKIKSTITNSLKEAVDEAMKVAKSGDIILLSPAFASFGMFKNEFDRGEQFVQLIQDL